jgi:putative endonuclease
LYFVYVLRNGEGRLYIGFTSNLERRVRQHQGDKGGWTQGRGPWELVHSETFDSRVEAMRRERSLKRGKANHDLRKALNSAVEQVLPQKD